MTKKDLIYAAGYFDGEGSISVTTSDQKQKYLRLVVQLTGKSKVCIDWLKDTFGGHVYIERHSNHPSTYYKWMLLGKHASQFLELILPFLKIKHQQAGLAVEFQEYKRPQFGSRALGVLEPKRQLEIRETIMNLNRRL